MVASSGTGFTHNSFRAAVASSDAASLKWMIRNALLASSCLAEVQQIGHDAVRRIERSMCTSLHTAPESAAPGYVEGTEGRRSEAAAVMAAMEVRARQGHHGWGA